MTDKNKDADELARLTELAAGVAGKSNPIPTIVEQKVESAKEVADTITIEHMKKAADAATE